MIGATPLIFIVGHTRSGTTAFRDLLEGAGALSCDEVMHAKPHPKRPRFYDFVAQHVAERPELIHPSHHRALFRAFVDDLQARSDGRQLVFDIKYWALDLIPGVFEVTGDLPFLPGFMRNQRASVIHIFRGNKLRMCVSAALAARSGRWNARPHQVLSQGKPPIWLDPETTEQRIRVALYQDQRVTRMLAKVPAHATLKYEEMFHPDGMFSEQAVALASELLGGAPVAPDPKTQRLNPEPLAALIENYDEISDALRAGPYAWMLE